MFDIGWDVPRRSGTHQDVKGWITRQDEPQPTLMDPDLPPGPPTHPMSTEKGSRNRPLVPDWPRPVEAESLRQLGPIAQWAVDGCSDPLGTFRGIDNPRSESEGRLVTDVLAVPARELCDTVPVVIAAESHDRSQHGPTVSVCPKPMLLAPRARRTPLCMPGLLVRGVESGRGSIW